MNKQDHVMIDPANFPKTNGSSKATFRAPCDTYANVKSRVYYNPSVHTDTDHIKINSDVLDFVVDGIRFDEQVVMSKAPFTLPYDQKYIEKIFQDKYKISDDFEIEKCKYKTRNEHSMKLVEKMRAKKCQLAITVQTNSTDEKTSKKVKFKNVGFFEDNKKKSLSDGDLEKNLEKMSNLYIKKKSSESLNGFFLTEVNECRDNDQREKIAFIENYDWDNYLVDSLSENTARWIVMKQVSDPKRKKKLQAFVESKFGRYVRDIDELELGEDSYTEFEKKKILEEKERINQEKNQLEK